jgi:hypothetical protein
MISWGLPMRNAVYFLAIFLLSQAAPARTISFQLEINLKHDDSRERQTKEQLQRLLANYDISNWVFTRKIIIESDVIPHSHPVLTLSTRHLKDDDLLLSTFVHEQLHWYLDEKPKETEEAYKEFKAVFPKVPVRFPEGANDEESTARDRFFNA